MSLVYFLHWGNLFDRTFQCVYLFSPPHCSIKLYYVELEIPQQSPIVIPYRYSIHSSVFIYIKIYFLKSNAWALHCFMDTRGSISLCSLLYLNNSSFSGSVPWAVNLFINIFGGWWPTVRLQVVIIGDTLKSINQCYITPSAKHAWSRSRADQK